MENYKTQKSHQGKTAGGFLKNAKIVKTAIGEPVLWIPQLGCEALQNDDLNLHLCLSDYYDTEDIVLLTSGRASEKLGKLISEMEKAYAH